MYKVRSPGGCGGIIARLKRLSRPAWIESTALRLLRGGARKRAMRAHKKGTQTHTRTHTNARVSGRIKGMAHGTRHTAVGGGGWHCQQLKRSNSFVEALSSALCAHSLARTIVGEADSSINNDTERHLDQSCKEAVRLCGQAVGFFPPLSCERKRRASQHAPAARASLL